ncbi:MAG: glycosyltransferase family 39 protein [Candidatus Omnitrophica bacterium]|nr:glycosyltransferase family 39 protein [Candidatus Omnitrophota bacterium]
MPSGLIKKIGIFFMLGLLTASAFFIRLENFKNSQMRSIDEIVYYRMAKQVLNEGLSGYNTIPYGKELAAHGRPLPDYFFQPLFKHPPLFTCFLVFSMGIFGANIQSAVYVPLLAAALMIPLVYLLGALVFDRRAGILAALFLWMDPVSVICSQKVWMESTLAFWMVLSIYFFAYALYRNKDHFLIFSGVSCALAVLTKYTGILCLMIALYYAWMYRRDLFRNRKFLIGFCLPFVFLLPWVFWNYQVYGRDFFFIQKSLHHDAARVIIGLSGSRLVFMVILVFVIVIGWNIYRHYRPQGPLPPVSVKESFPKRLFMTLLTLFTLTLLIWVVFPQIKNSLDMNFLPKTSWRTGAFAQESPLFYFQQLMAFSFIYFFAFLSILGLPREDTEKKRILTASAILILSFFILWRNYQSRYILPCLPFLIVLASQFLFKVYDMINKIAYFIPYILSKAVFVLGVIFIIAKTTYVNHIISYPNDLCFF